MPRTIILNIFQYARWKWSRKVQSTKYAQIFSHLRREADKVALIRTNKGNEINRKIHMKKRRKNT